MASQFERTELVIGKEGQEKLRNAKVVVFGVGGVGSFVVEALARAGVGKLILIDKDEVDITNINRQIIATHKTVGRDKVDVAKERILDINPNAEVEVYKEFFIPESKDVFDSSVSYVVDAVDTVTAKIEIILRAKKLNVPVISSMGTGNKLDPCKFEIADISKTTICPLAKVMRKELKQRNINNVKVLYSKEEPIKQEEKANKDGAGTMPKAKLVQGSISVVPSVAGLIIAGEVIKDIIGV